MTAELQAGVIGNCAIAAVINQNAEVSWACMPRFDGDPVFHSLLGRVERRGGWQIELENVEHIEQSYRSNTAILVTRMRDTQGNSIEITDFAPRFMQRGRIYRPMMLIRRVRCLRGRPRVRVCLKPSFDHGAQAPTLTQGSHHIRYVGQDLTLRLTCDVAVDYIRKDTPFVLEGEANFILGPDEALSDHPAQIAHDFEHKTQQHWQLWCRRLTLPLEWQDAVIRAAITLKLCIYEPTGAIVAALTSSVPESADSGRNWDYRYCWLRDAFFVVRALNSLSDMEALEHYLQFINNVVAEFSGDHVQPVFGIGLETELTEWQSPHLPGFRGMGPVRFGNQAHEHIQHDVYGNIVLAVTQAFFDQRLLRPGNLSDFTRLKGIGERAWAVYQTPDAGMWELRSRAQVHTSSALMCWAACDRLARIAQRFNDPSQAQWAGRAASIRQAIEEQAFNPELNSYTDTFGGQEVEAGLLLMAEVGFHPNHHPRLLGTVARVEKRLLRQGHVLRYCTADDFGEPDNAFTVCTFWYIDNLIRMGRKEQAREYFERLLQHRNHLGLMSEDLDFQTGALWGNFPQTYSMVGLINTAMRLSRSWESVI